MGYKLAMDGFALGLLVTSMEILGAAAGDDLQLPAMYVFGDSTLDVGNNNYLPGTNVPRADKPYYGIDFPGFPTGRFSNGYNTADLIAKKIGFKNSPPPYLSLAPSSGLLVATALSAGVSYASGGAGILDSTNAGNNIPLSKQVQYFSATRSEMIAAVGSGEVRARLNRSVVLIGIAGNDLSVFANAEQAHNRSASEHAAAFYDTLISNYSAAITDLYDLGARKFAVIGVGLAGCLPMARVLDAAAGACDGDRNQLAGGFNDAVGSLLASLAARLPGFVYSLADSLGLMAATFADGGGPQASSGFTDVADACCGVGRLGGEGPCRPNATLCADRDRFYFWDWVHPTQRAAMLRAQAFYDGPPQYTTPINFKQLVDTIA